MRTRISSNEFVAAIEKSLEELVTRGVPITQTSVISNARTRNGQPVGKTTLYRKNDSTGDVENHGNCSEKRIMSGILETK